MKRVKKFASGLLASWNPELEDFSILLLLSFDDDLSSSQKPAKMVERINVRPKRLTQIMQSASERQSVRFWEEKNIYRTLQFKRCFLQTQQYVHRSS